MNSCFRLMILFLAVAGNASGQTITTISGNHVAGYSGNGGPATAARMLHPNQLTVDGAGNVYFAETDNNVIRRVNAAGVIELVAGTHIPGFMGDGGPATAARLDAPSAVKLDAAGNIYITEINNNRVRKIDVSGIITTVVGNGTAAYSGDGGPATAASIYAPFEVAFDALGNMFIADAYNNCIRKVTTAGIISTVAGDTVSGYSGDGGPATAAELSIPIDIGFDRAGNMYIDDANNSAIRKITPAGIISTIAGNGMPGFSGDGGPASASLLRFPYALCLDTADNIYITDNANERIRKIDAATGIINTIVGTGAAGYTGDGGPATAATISNTGGVTTDVWGNIYIADFGNNVVRKVTNNSLAVQQLTGGAEGVVTIYPNPVGDQLSVSIKRTGPEQAKVLVTDMAGRVWYRNDQSTSLCSVDFRQMPVGAYLIYVTVGSSSYASRVVKE